MITSHSLPRLAVAGVAILSLSGCMTLDRLSKVGQTPELSAVENPTHEPDYKPVSMPMPQPITADRAPNSLWRPGARAFFKDLRANEIGDIVTVSIEINDNAAINNESTRERNNSERAGAPSLLGFEGDLDKILPEAVNPGSLLSVTGTTNNTGKGSITRNESIELKVAAVVTQVLPNGNLVIHGRQETRVDFEVRELQVAGIIRPQDISSNNQIAYDKIAEARLAYGGRGHISDFMQPRWGTQIIDVVFPF